jgi:hypothetical protein
MTCSTASFKREMKKNCVRSWISVSVTSFLAKTQGQKPLASSCESGAVWSQSMLL